MSSLDVFLTRVTISDVGVTVQQWAMDQLWWFGVLG
jgi:hypothetical protein